MAGDAGLAGWAPSEPERLNARADAAGEQDPEGGDHGRTPLGVVDGRVVDTTDRDPVDERRPVVVVRVHDRGGRQGGHFRPRRERLVAVGSLVVVQAVRRAEVGDDVVQIVEGHLAERADGLDC